MRPRLALLLVVAVLVLVPAAAWGLMRANDAAEPGVPWDSYRPVHEGVAVFRLMRSCERVTDVDVSESGGRVEITLHVGTGSEGCGEIAAPQPRRVALDNALGTRAVYDGACLDRGFATSLCRRDVRTGLIR